MATRQKWSRENIDEGTAHFLASQLAPLLMRGDIIALRGNLGAGKTSFARAMIRSFCQNPLEEVPSPTFTLVQTYQGENLNGPKIWHFDLYRLSNPVEALELDIEDAFRDHISLIEWPENLGEHLPKNCLIITITTSDNDQTRSYHFNGDENWTKRLDNLKSQTP